MTPEIWTIVGAGIALCGIGTGVVSDQAKRLAVLEEAVLRTTRSPDDREAQH